MASFYNSEHYPDPTAYHAIKNIDRKNKVTKRKLKNKKSKGKGVKK